LSDGSNDVESTFGDGMLVRRHGNHGEGLIADYRQTAGQRDREWVYKIAGAALLIGEEDLSAGALIGPC
jgi:hypothetical protein